MPAAEFRRQLLARGDRDHVWKVLTDVPRLAGWVSIVGEATEIEPLSRYEAVLADRVGPFRLTAHLDIRVPEVTMRERIRVIAQGEDRQVSSRIGVDATLTLSSDDDDVVTVIVEGRYEVVGRVASMGGGIIAQKAQKILDEFFAQAQAELA